MTSKVLKEVMERVESWPEERQEDAARVLIEMEEQDASQYHLADDQVEEVKRRRAKPDPKFLALEEVPSAFRAPSRMKVIARDEA